MKKGIFIILLGAILTSCDRCEREDFKPEKYYTIEGRMINSETGKPIKNMALRLKGYDDYGNTKWAVDRDTTDENGNFSLRYRYKDVGVELKSYVIYEKEGHLGLPIEIIRSSDTINFRGDFCYPLRTKVGLSFNNVGQLNELDSIYIIFSNGEILEEYRNLQEFNFIDANSNISFREVGFLLSKEQSISANVVVTPEGNSIRIPNEYFDNLYLYCCLNKEKLKNFTMYEDYKDTTLQGVFRVKLNSCKPDHLLEVDVSKLPK